MNNDQLDDLKQFILASISQSEGRLRHEFVTAISESEGRLRGEMSQGFQTIRNEMSDGFLAVGEAIEEIHQQLEAHNAKFEEVDKRLTKLEQRMA